MESTNKTMKHFVILLVLSVVVIISPIILALIYFSLDTLGIMPLPKGIEALGFGMIFTVPAGIIFFFVGSLILFLLNLRRKSLMSIEEHMKKINKSEEENKNT